MSKGMKVGFFDLETNGLLDRVTCIHCAVIREHNTGSIKAFTPSDIDQLRAHLATFDVLIGHNCVAFDFPVLKKIWGWQYKGKIVDTLLMSRLQRPHRARPKGYVGRSPHSVEAWALRFGEEKVEHDEWDRYSDAMLERCKQDVKIQSLIYEALLEEGNGMGWEDAHRLNVKIFQYLHIQERYGWKIDRRYMERCINTLSRWIVRINMALAPHLPLIVEKLETKKDGEYNYVRKPFKKDGNWSAQTETYLGRECSNLAGPFSRINIRSLNLDSTIEVKQFLLDEGWQPEKWNEKDGKRTSANLSKDDPFNGIESSLGNLVAKRIQCRQRKSILEGWKSNIRHDGRLSGRIAGLATTGRLRHSLIVNVPSPHSGAFFAKQMRKCFIPKPRWVMVGVDSKGNQMRQLAGRMDDDEFTKAVLFGSSDDGTDLHSLNQKKSGASSRTVAKNFFYGSILFGAGDAKTAELLKTTKQKARQIKATYMAGMPKLKKVIDDLIREWRVTAKRTFNKKWNRVEYYDGYIRGIDGRAILVPYEKDLLCYALQSDEAVHMGVAYVMVHKWAEERGWRLGVDWGLLIWMHDEFQMECKPEIADELGQMGCDAIKWAGEWLKIKCEHDGEYLVGRNWCQTH